jgi:hypothetical protein
MEPKKLYLEAEMNLQEETPDLKRAVASVINLPKENEKQPDLLYFSAIFVSSGANLNKAFFLPSELVKAEHTIVNKALDVEHKEEEIIGHLYDRAFIDVSGKKLDLKELASMENAALDNKDMHVIVAGIIYKNRFPNIAKEVSDKKWFVSMECYYQDYDVKIGDMVVSRPEAEAMGLANDESIFAKVARVIKNGTEIAKGNIERVLKNIYFSGCGIVKNPANPPSVIVETANKKIVEDDDGIITINLDTNNKLTSSNIEEPSSNKDGEEKEGAELTHNDTVGICVSFKKRVFAHEPVGPDTEVLHEDWCALYESSCTSFSRDTTDPKCLKYEIGPVVRTYANQLLTNKKKSDRRDELVALLELKINATKKLD